MSEKTFWSTYVNDYGWSIIPIQTRSKKPIIGAWRAYQDRKPTDEEIKSWEGKYPHNNVAVICGAVSNLVVLDIDSEDGYKWIKQNGYKIPKTPRTESSPGKGHFYFQHPGFPVKNMIRKVPGIDIKGDGGYVVAPPSMHPSGARYRWIDNFEPDKVSVAPCPSWLLELINQEKKPQEAAAKVGESANGKVTLHETDDTDDQDRVNVLLSYGATEGNRNNSAAILAGYFFARGLAMDKVLGILTGWNRLNDPPLPPEELRRTVESIAKSEASKKLREEPYARKREGEDVGGGVLDLEEKRQSYLGGATDILGMPIRHIKKVLGESPQYILLIENTEVTLTAKCLMQQQTFRTKIMEATNRIPLKVKSAQQWEGLVQNLLDVAEVVETGEESTTMGDLKGQLIEYISLSHIFDIDNEDRPMSEFDMPFIWGGRLYINRNSFLKWSGTYLMARTQERKSLTQYFTRLGLEYIRPYITQTGVVKRQFRVWKIPEDMFKAAMGQKKGGEAIEEKIAV